MSDLQPKRDLLAGVGVVVIGRNEGERLRRSLTSASELHARCVYVDSGSQDGSPEIARNMDVAVVELDPSRPFTAARSRNAGYVQLKQMHEGIDFVQFLDGDCELECEWLKTATSALLDERTLAAVCGVLRELAPDASVYNRLCSIEWQAPEGLIDACGGNAMFRSEALDEARGFREDLIAGEEPEMCLRMRRRGWLMRRVSVPMAVHDASMFRFHQWWTRAIRSGHTYAEGAWLHGREPEHYRVSEVLGNSFWGIGVPLAAALAAVASWEASVLVLAAYPLVAVRIAKAKQREGVSRSDAWLYARFCVLGKLPETLGMLRFFGGLLRNRRSPLIEYK